MTAHITLAGLALAAAVSTPALLAFPAPAAADPVCVPGFQTIEKTSWLLKCRKTVPIAQKGVALTEAGNANCTPDRYWNYGPAVTSQTYRARNLVVVEYTCGHVEG